MNDDGIGVCLEARSQLEAKSKTTEADRSRQREDEPNRINFIPLSLSLSVEPSPKYLYNPKKKTREQSKGRRRKERERAMEVEVPGSKLVVVGGRNERTQSEEDRLRVKRKTLEIVLQQCQRAIELLSETGCIDDDDDDREGSSDGAALLDGDESGEGSSASFQDKDADELCDLLKSRVECRDFLEKLESAQASGPRLADDGNSWDMVSENDLWEGGNSELDQEDYVLVRQDDIVDGIACFMAAYLLSLEKTKDLTPNQLQEALSKTFSVSKKKGKLRKAWDGSKVVYNVASWGATAIGIYQNPAILKAASAAFWTSCHVISKFF